MFPRSGRLNLRRLGALFAFILAFALVIPGLTMTAKGEARQVDVEITKFVVWNLEKKEVDRISLFEEFFLHMEWDASTQGTTLKEGDYFLMQMPDTMKFPNRPGVREFDLLEKDTNIVFGRGYVEPGEGDIGGQIRFVLNKEVENRYHVRGEATLVAKFNTETVTENNPVTFTVKVGKEFSTEKPVTPTGHGQIGKEILNKWVGGPPKGPDGQPDLNKATWVVRINHQGLDLGDVTLTDKMTPANAGSHLQDKFVLYEGKYEDPTKMDFTPDHSKTKRSRQLIDEGLLEFPDNNTFKLTLKNSGKKQYRLEYQTTYNTPGEVLRNNVTLESTTVESKKASSRHIVASSSGTATGDLASKIKLIKVDADNEATLLKNAVFTVTGPDGKTFELTTNDQGEAISGVLEQGEYKVKEKTPPAGYELNDQEFTLKVTPQGGAIQKVTDKRITIDIPVVKFWDDKDNQAGLRPQEVEVQLVANDKDVEGQKRTLRPVNNWKDEFKNVPKFDTNGDPFNYTVRELNPPADYGVTVTGDASLGFSVTNSHVPEVVRLPVKKKWLGPGADSVKVQLLGRLDDAEPYEDVPGAILTLTKDEGWQGSFENLPKLKEGKLVSYAVKELDVDTSKYQVEIDNKGACTVYRATEECGSTITNRNIEKVDISGVKTWNDDDDRDRKRPKEITVKLLADRDVVKEETVTPGADGSWSYSFKGLNKYAADDGHEIVYTVDEAPVDGYEKAINGTNITNTYSPETVDIPVKKEWVGPKGTQATVQLFDTDGEVAGKTLTLNEGNGWQGVFAGLPKYKEGNEIKYTVKEVDVDTSKYEVTVSDFVPCPLPRADQQVRADAECGFTITNKNIEKVKVEGVKTWDDDNDRDSKRPNEITVRLKAKGTEQASQKVTAANNWAYSFTDLPKYDNDGNEILYMVSEDAVGEYATKIDADGTITNSYTPGKTSVTVSKVWDDADNQDGVRPDSVKVQLKAYGEAVGEPVVLNADNKWTHTWTDLFINDNTDKKKIEYTVEEVDVPQGYEVKVEGDAQKGYTVTNTHVPEQVSIPVVKKWEGKTGASATFHLYAGKADTGKVLTLDATVNWKGSFDGLPKFKDGEEIAYTITEDALEGYEAKVKGDMRDGFTVTNTYVDKKLAKTGFSGSGLLLGSTILGGAGAVMLAVRRKREHA
ncbi:Cna B-type domain-containing protein [Schaalia cardiffensis]|uniref:Cna B-type domain-containing protein n=1 Tax=Schaalia cardiffensis TaxID=181487 RepID=UPI0023F07999|nr:Cna B-type domain-containing protein [Schaalia cardiffensis]